MKVLAVADEIAVENGGKTLEMVMAEKGVDKPADGDRKAWDANSLSLAQNALGVVRVVLGEDLQLNNTWTRVELPALVGNERVREIISIYPAMRAENVILTR